jgi:predicted short-subunit dehydrogenase-like oxidoreductase (DUF2520 family)
MARGTALRFAVVGAGRVGPVLGRILVERGHRCTAVISRSLTSARRGRRFIGAGRTGTSVRSIPGDTNLIFITAAHGAVGEIVTSLAASRPSFRGIAVCHASGIHTAAILEPLRRMGGTVFSFHPLQTFPRDFTHGQILPSARGIPFGVDGTAAGLRKARRVARAFGGRAICIPPERRVLYHAACVVASNHVTTLLWIVERMFAKLGMKGEGSMAAVAPIIGATLANVFRRLPEQALSGPVARGGTETVAAHCAAVRRFLPELLPVFAAVSLETVALAEKRGSASRESIRAMRRLLIPLSTLSNPNQEKS